MRLHEINNGVPVILNNEEQKFVKTFRNHVLINSLNEHEKWIAQNLVRKNVYTIIDNDRYLKLNEHNKTI